MPEKAEEKDLDALRDEKCIPIARGVLVDLAANLLPVDASKNIDLTTVLMAIMARVLEADLNLVMDVPYVFQLVLSGMSGLNATVQTCEMTPMNDMKYDGIAKKILAILAQSNVTLEVPNDPKGKPDAEKLAVDFAPVKEQIQALIKENNLSGLEVKYIMDNIFQSFQAVESTFMHTMAGHVQKAEAKLFKLEFFTDLTMKKVDEVLKE